MTHFWKIIYEETKNTNLTRERRVGPEMRAFCILALIPRAGYNPLTMNVTVILTVLNEAGSLPRLLDSLAAQTRPPDEIIVVDGGSHDGTPDLLRAKAACVGRPLTVIERPGSNISQGRNAAIAAARGDVIAITDAGVRLAPTWLERLVAPFEESARDDGQRPGPAAVAGFFHPDPHTLFEVAMGATVLPELRDVNPQRFLPSSRSCAVRKDAAQAIGGYPEWLDFCEDLIFDLRLRERFGPFIFAPDALVHFRPRGSLRAFFKQYYRYARGDGKADLWRARHLVRYLTYLVAIPGIGLLGWRWGRAWCWLYLLSIPGMFLAPWRRLLPWLRDGDYGPLERLRAFLWVPVIRVVGDVAKMVGYPVGLWWRWRHRPPNWK
jgi:glycosyltransferase involved in cell wall biosynthesis